MAKAISKARTTKTNGKTVAQQIEEQDAADSVSVPAPAPRPTKGKAGKRQPNPQSYRHTAINILRDNPGKSQEHLISLMDKAKPGKTSAYWKRRIARAYTLATILHIDLPACPASTIATAPKATKPRKAVKPTEDDVEDA